VVMAFNTTSDVPQTDRSTLSNILKDGFGTKREKVVVNRFVEFRRYELGVVNV